MAWLSSGSSNAGLIANLRNHGLITSERVATAMLGVRSLIRPPFPIPRSTIPPFLLLLLANSSVSQPQVDRAHYSPAVPYQDSPQTIGFSATISAPHMHASAAESLLPFLHPSARVLDIGSGSGYLTHVLANLIGPEGKVVGVDHIQGLVDLAERNVRKSEDGRGLLQSGRVRFVKGDGREGFREGAPWDAIHVGAAAREEHAGLLEQLQAPGRMFIPVGDAFGQYIWVVDKKEDGSITREKSFAVRYVPLTDAPKD
ncbi:MAG: hypothetical protein LQ351_003907 [Letrouitia transgressa]|nr:MAG: hypothetical protein LQ351_003907 [Letrouitia transgressa]